VLTQAAAGYWWWHEDDLDASGIPLGHPNATHWRPIGPLPDTRREAMDSLLAEDGELYGEG
jgi:hypothetical protein